MKEAQDDVLLHGKQRDAKQGDDQQLDRAHFAKKSPVGDQRAGTAEVSVDETVRDQAEGHEEWTSSLVASRICFIRDISYLFCFISGLII